MAESVSAFGQAAEEGAAKLLKKVRVGSKLRRRYDVPRTPLDRLVASEGNDSSYLMSRNNLIHRREELDPFALSRQIEDKLQRVYALANVRQSPRVSSNDKPRRVTF